VVLWAHPLVGPSPTELRAGRVRPSIRRPGRTQEVANAEPEPPEEALPVSE
jgi:hypothetical protein